MTPSPSPASLGADGEAPITGAPAAPSARPARPRRLSRLRAAWARRPLRSQLTIIVVALTSIGLLGATIAATMLVRLTMLQQVDASLRSTTTQMTTTGLSVLVTVSGQTVMPTDYYLSIHMAGGDRRTWWYPGVVEQYGAPDLDGAPVPTEGATILFTAQADTDVATTGWRVIAIPVVRSDTAEQGTAYLALPLADVENVTSQLGLILGTVSLAISAAAAAIGNSAVRRSLRPLAQIEATASSIAAGDLSARVPQSPRGTEIGSLAQSLNTMLSQIEASIAARDASEARTRRFASDASHELRTPLATIRGYSELYQMGALTDQEALDDTMRRIGESARRMGLLVEDLLTLTRLDEGQSLRHEPVDLSALADDGASDLFALDPTRTVGRERYHTGPLWVVGDENKLRQVVVNLVGNAARHTPAGTPVEIVTALDPAAGLGIFEIRDHGPGIPPADADRVFERFFRADSSRDRRSGGSGLGLAIVKAICTALGGTASVRTTDGGGLTVAVAIPLVSPAHHGAEPDEPDDTVEITTSRPRH